MEEELSRALNDFELVKLNEKAENAVAAAAAVAAATGAAPIPFADAPILIGEQVALMATICGIYGINISKDGLKMLATAAIGTGGATVVGRSLATGLLKLIPGAGTLAGGAISAGTAGVVTLAMGKAFIEVCKMVKVGKLSETDLTSKEGTDLLAAQFKEQLKKNQKTKAKKERLNLPREFKSSNVSKPKGAKLPKGASTLGLRTEGTSALLLCMYVDEQASMPFDDNQGIIDALHNQLGEEEGLIEVNSGVTNNGKPYVYDIIKHHRFEKDGTPSQFGVEYTLNLNIKDENVIHFINGSFQEEGTTGLRDSMVLAWYCNANDCQMSEAFDNWFKDPYDDTIKKGYLMNYSEREQFDGMFPDHPLSKLRDFISYVVENN